MLSSFLRFSLFTTTACISSFSFAENVENLTAGKVYTNTQTFALQLNQSRVIYNPESKGTSLTINNPQDYPILVQSKVLEEDKVTPSSFVITPPLFRLDAKQQSRVKILMNDAKHADDREKLKWLCVTGIPPKLDDAWANDIGADKSVKKDTNINLKISVSNCVKLFVRPQKLRDDPADLASKINWSRTSAGLKAENNTPYYMSLSFVAVNGKKIKDVDYIEPYSSKIFTSDDKSGKIEWKVVNDYGGESDKFEGKISSN
ncbi:chaperone protein AfaB [Enterobacter cloacae]|nr:chaperone protein AfaB [Enterobacter cloacae]